MGKSRLLWNIIETPAHIRHSTLIKYRFISERIGTQWEGVKKKIWAKNYKKHSTMQKVHTIKYSIVQCILKSKTQIFAYNNIHMN